MVRLWIYCVQYSPYPFFKKKNCEVLQVKVLVDQNKQPSRFNFMKLFVFLFRLPLELLI